MNYAILIPTDRLAAVAAALPIEPRSYGTGSGVTHHLAHGVTNRDGIDQVVDLAAAEPTVRVWLDGNNQIYIQSKLGGNVEAFPELDLNVHLNREFGINRSIFNG